MRYQVFISYRRGSGEQLALVVHTQLNKVHGIKTFLDVADLRASKFDEQLRQYIHEADNLVVILTPGDLDRCVSETDWLRQEIALALSENKNIIPILANGFRFPNENELPNDIRSIWKYNAVTYVHEYYGAVLQKLVDFLKVDSSGTDMEAPLPLAERQLSKIAIENATNYPKNVKSVIEDGIPRSVNGIVTPQTQQHSANEEKYIEKMKEFLSDGQLSEVEKSKSSVIAEVLSISPERARELEQEIKAELELGSLGPLKDEERKYIGKFKECLQDGEISEKERLVLQTIAETLEIDAERATRIEVAIMAHQPPTQGSDDIQADVPGESAPIVAEHEEASAGWINVAVKFLNDLRDHISADDLPFRPVEISNNDSIKDSLEVDWSINEKRYFAIWITAKRASKATTKMGIYSTHEKRDPDFRRLCDAIAGAEELLNSDGQVEISGRMYEFVSDGCLGFETGERVEIVNLAQPDFLESIRKDFVGFCGKVWPVIKERV